LDLGVFNFLGGMESKPSFSDQVNCPLAYI
jgi:hypothetical protein